MAKVIEVVDLVGQTLVAVSLRGVAICMQCATPADAGQDGAELMTRNAIIDSGLIDDETARCDCDRCGVNVVPVVAAAVAVIEVPNGSYTTGHEWLDYYVEPVDESGDTLPHESSGRRYRNRHDAYRAAEAMAAELGGVDVVDYEA